MAKWADYLISAVRYNSEHSHITHLKVREDKGDTVGVGENYTRQTVVNAINNETSFITIYKSESNEWKKGAKVYIFKVNGTNYIKTVDNQKEEDNLGGLPRF